MLRFWFKYKPVSNGFFLPYISAELSAMDKTVLPDFLCDTGAVTSWAKMHLFAVLFPNEYDQIKNNLPTTGIVDASGRPILGVKKLVTISIYPAGNRSKKISFSENIYFGNIGFNLLGQTAFETIGGHFHNFPTSRRGRKFAIFTNNLGQGGNPPPAI